MNIIGDMSNFMKGLPSSEHFEVEGKILGLVGGRGKIGERVKSIALSLGMKVVISSRNVSLTEPTSENVEYTDSIDDLLKKSDFVSLHCPLNSEVGTVCYLQTCIR